MTVYVSDAFTDTDATLLTAHSPSTGGAWSTLTTSPVIVSNAITGIAYTQCQAVNAASPATADYSVSCDVTVNYSPSGDVGGVQARRLDATHSYRAFFDNATQVWTLAYGPYTLLGTFSDPSFVSGTKHVELQVLGSLITVLIAGVPQIVVTDTTSGAIGLAGALVGGNFNGVSLDNFLAEDIPGGSPSVHVLTGAGSVTIATPAWLSVALASRPPTSGNGTANPPNYYNVGKLSWGTSNGAMNARSLSRDLELLELPSGMTTLWYTIPPGETATVTELSAP